MKQEYQNLADYFNEVGKQRGEKTKLIRLIQQELGVSRGTIERWMFLDNKTDNPDYLAGLSRITGIKIEDLFRRHEK